MSTYEDFLGAVRGLKPNTKFVVDAAFCESRRLTVNSSIVKAWGRKFAKDYDANGCVPDTDVPNPQGRSENKTSDNLAHYIKQ